MHICHYSRVKHEGIEYFECESCGKDYKLVTFQIEPGKAEVSVELSPDNDKIGWREALAEEKKIATQLIFELELKLFNICQLTEKSVSIYSLD